MFPNIVTSLIILSLRAVVVACERQMRKWEYEDDGSSEQGGGLLESAVVNLQTASQSGNDARQKSSSLTAQLHLVIALRLISLSPFHCFLHLMYMQSLDPLSPSLPHKSERLIKNSYKISAGS